MAENGSHNKPQRLVFPETQQNPSKFSKNLLHKALFFTFFIVILPLFPSQAPEFINQTASTGSWELLQLLFVGIAVSYGLFSRINDDSDKENSSKFDNAQSYVSRFLQVSSVFDDENETPSGSDENKVQTWSSQYFRNDPVVVLTQESHILDDTTSTKPFTLPVRSLKSCESSNGDSTRSLSGSNSMKLSSNSLKIARNGEIGNVGHGDFDEEHVENVVPQSRSKFSRSYSSKARIGEFKDVGHGDFDEKMEENVVLRSPIPWKSRSGRIEWKGGVVGGGPPLYSLPPSMEEFESNRDDSQSFRSQSGRSSRNNSNSPSPKNLSPSSSMSSEVEDSGRKKSFYRSTPPPAPPLPPSVNVKRPSVNSSSRLINNGFEVDSRDLNRSFRSETKDLSTANGGSSMKKSVRTVRASEATLGTNGNGDKRSHDFEATSMEKSKGKTVRFDQTSVKISKPSFGEFPKEEKREYFPEKVEIENDEEWEGEDEDVVGTLNNEESSSTCATDGGPDVDKKADEFIAKFREQIRLQRIESIKRSSGQIDRNSSR